MQLRRRAEAARQGRGAGSVQATRVRAGGCWCLWGFLFKASLLLPLPERPHLPSPPPPPRQVRRTKARAGSQRTSSTGIPSRVTMSAAAPAGTPASPSARRRAARAASRTAAIESVSGRTETVRVESPDIRSQTLPRRRVDRGARAHAAAIPGSAVQGAVVLMLF